MRRRCILPALLVFLSVLAAACSSSDPDESSEPFQSDIGCDPRLDETFEEWADRGISASVALFDPERQCVAAYGLADRETGRENDVDTVFAIGSITKPMTSAAIYALIDRGELTLESRASEFVDGLDGVAGHSIIRDLLLHTSGIKGEHGYDHVPMSRSEAIESLSLLESVSEPGAAYRYENSNYTILALVVDALSENGYRQFIVDEILLDRNGDPIPGGWWDGTPAPVGERAWGYEGDTPALQRGQAPGPHWAMEGNGGMAMTPVQMAEWTWALFNGRILSPGATELLLSTSTRLAGGFDELAGWGAFGATLFGEPVIATAGGGSGIGHEMNIYWLPDSDRMFVFARNANDLDVRILADDVIPALVTGTGMPGPPVVPAADPETLEAMVGTFSVGDAGSITVVENDGGLAVTATGIEAIAALHQTPEALEGDVAAHEASAREVLEGTQTPESRRRMDRLESEFGPMRGFEVEGTYFDGILSTVATLRFDDEVVTAWLETDFFGVMDVYPAFPEQGHPVSLRRFLVNAADVTWADTATVDLTAIEGFAEQYADERNVHAVLQPSDDGFVIVTSLGSTLATRSSE